VSDEIDETMPYDHGEVCEHGGLKRKCDTCWAEWERDTWKKRAEQLERDRDDLAAEVVKWRQFSSCEPGDEIDVAAQRTDASGALTRAKEIE